MIRTDPVSGSASVDGCGRLKVATLSKSDLTGGGASKVAQILADRFRQRDPGSVHFLMKSPLGTHAGRREIFGSRIGRSFHSFAHNAGRRIGFAESLPIETVRLLRSIGTGFDVLHVHDTTSAVSPLSLLALSRRLPVLWTLHDSSPFTGGCIQPMDCVRFRTGCGSCPQSRQWPIDGIVDMTRLHRALRASVHGSGRVELASPSRWTAGMAVSSGMVGTSPHIVPNPVDADVFAPPVDKRALRRRLGIREEGMVLVAVAGHVNDPRKGVAHALRVASGLSALDPHLVLVGRPDRSLSSMLDGISVTATGFVCDEAELAGWYGAADAFVYCSSIDNQPLTILESMSCGIPTYGFSVGGSGELVEDGVNGRMVAHGDVERLVGLLAADAENGRLETMGAAARAGILERHAIPAVVDAYADLLRDVAFRWNERNAGNLR